MAKSGHKKNMSGNIAKGAAGVALAAGVVAAGAALANKDTREKIGKTAQKGMNTLQDVAGSFADEDIVKSLPVAHEVRGKKKAKNLKRAGGKS